MSGTATAPRPRVALRRALTPLRAAYAVVLGEPMREGRLSLGGVDPASRQLAVGALIALVAMLCSLLLNESWRHGALVDVGTDRNAALLPQALVPVTLVALFVAWLAITSGAAAASRPVRLAVAGLFLALNASLAKPAVFPINDSPALAWTPSLALAAYAFVPAVVVLLPEARRWRRVRRRLRPLALGALVLGTGLFFGASLWAQAGQVAAGIPLTVPAQLGGAITSIQAFLVPMVFVSVLSIVNLSYGIAEAASGPFWRLGPLAAKAALLVLLGLKLWREVGRRATEWQVYFEQREAAVIRTLLGLLLLASLAFAARRLRPRARACEEMKERVAYTGALVLALPVLVVVLLSGLKAFLVIVFEATGSVRLLDLPAGWVAVSSPVFWGLVLAGAGALLVRCRRRDSPSREAAIGLALTAVWAEFFLLPEAFGFEPGFDPLLLDATLTAAVAAYLVLRWRALDTRAAVWLGALVGFGWLVSTRGDLVAVVGRLFGLPATIVLAVGLVYALLTDSEFTRRSSRSVPRRARPLLWIGYLLLSATLANWALATHAGDPIEGPILRGFGFLGLPLAAWLLSWRPFDRVGRFAADEHAAERDPTAPA